MSLIKKKENRSANKKEPNTMFRKALIILSIISIITIPVFASSYNYDPSSVVIPKSKYMTSSNPNVIWVDYTDVTTDYGYFLNSGTTTITTNTGKRFNFEVTGTNTGAQGTYFNFIKNWTVAGSTDYDKIRNTLIYFKNNGYAYSSDGAGTGYGMIDRKEGTCTDYSDLLLHLCQTMEIPCTVVQAKSVGLPVDSPSHECNICYLEGHYYAVDLQAFVVSSGSNDMLDYCMKLLD